MFVTIEDETEGTQLFARPEVYEHCGHTLDGQVVIINGQAQRWDGESVIRVDRAETISIGMNMPTGHNWH